MAVAGCLLVTWGLSSEWVRLGRALPPWLRPFKGRIAAAALFLGLISGGFNASLLGSSVFGWCGLLFVPLWARIATRAFDADYRRRLEESSLPFFHALLGFLRAGLATPAALVRAIAAAPGPFADWLGDRVCRREKGEHVVEVLTRVRRSLPDGDARRCLEVLARLHTEGLGALELLENQVRWMGRERTRCRKILSLQASLGFQGALSAAMPWLVLWFSAAGSSPGPDVFGWEELWKSADWRQGLVLSTAWQALGMAYLYRLGRFF